MKRRDFLGITAAGMAGLAAWPAAAEAAGVPRAVLAHPHLLDILRDDSLVAGLGRRYREGTPDERTVPAIEAALLGEAPTPPPASPRAWLAEQVRRDFDAGRTVTIDGWVLSRTEARQAALFSLWIG